MDKVYIVVIEWYDGLCDYGSGIDSEVDKVFEFRDDALKYMVKEAEKEYERKAMIKNDKERTVIVEENFEEDYISVMDMVNGFYNAQKVFVPYKDGSFEESSTTWKIIEMEVE